MNAYAPVTIEEVKALGESHGLHQIVVWHFREGEGQQVTTWGPGLHHSALAAEAGNHVKRAAMWPPELCEALPQSLAVLFAEWEQSIAQDIANGVLHKGTVLAALMKLRDSIRARDPQLAEQLVMPACEAAEPGGGA